MGKSAKDILSAKGTKLSAHEVHIRRTMNRGYIVKHDMRDKYAKPPTDGQRDTEEYSLADKAALLRHIEQHMGDVPPDDEENEPNDTP